MTHLLVTNDFPPKVGGIQSYLWELWRRLPAGDAAVMTPGHPGGAAWDAQQPMTIIRTRGRVLLPSPALVRSIDAAADEVGADLVVLDPALPLGLVGPRLSRPYAVVVHGAEITVPGRLPLTSPALARVLRGSCGVVAAGDYPASEARRALGGAPVEMIVVPPAVDTTRFRVLDAAARRAGRRAFGLPDAARVVVSVSRLVPRKGMDVLIDAAAALAPDHPDVIVAIAGAGRDAARLGRRIASTRAPVRMLGAVPDEQLPALYGSADVFAMLCRDRWAGLEREGFGIVFLEAAATGVPQVAGDSGGASDAVDEGVTGLVVRRPRHVPSVALALRLLLDDPERRTEMGRASRRRAETDFANDVLAARLGAFLDGLPGGGRG